METREYNGMIYQRASADQDWQMVGPASGGAAGRIIPKAVDPADAYKVPQVQAQIGQATQGAARSAALLPTDLQKNSNDAERSAYERDKAAFEARGLGTGRNFERADKLRADYEALPSVKNYTQALPVFGAGLQSKADSAGDLNLIYAYAKVMDPNSVVREGEQASVAGGDTWINAKTAQLQKQLGQGGTFKPEYRKRLREEMAGRMGELNQSFIADRVRYKGISDRYGVNPQDVVGEHPGGRFQDVSKRVLGREQQQLDYNGMPIATGATRTERDDKASALIDTLVRGGASVQEINSALQPLGMRPIEQAQYDKVRKYLAANPNYKGSFGEATREVPQSLANRVAGSPIGTFVGAGVDAAMGGLTDELAGTVQSAFNGQPIGENIQRLDRAKQAAFAQNPNAALGGQVIGQVGSMIGLGSLLKGLGAGAQFAGDVGFSALSGAGQNNDSRLLGATAGAVGGAGGNLAGRAAAEGVGALARTAPGLSLLNRGRSLFGAPMINNAPALSMAESALAKPLAGDAAADVTAALQRARDLGAPYTLADANPALGELAGASARRSPDVLNLAEDTLTRRSRGQIDRLGASVEANLGPIGNILELSKGLRKQAQTAAGPLYDQAYAVPAASSETLEGLMSRPFVRDALGKARTIAANEGRDPSSLGFTYDANGAPLLRPSPRGPDISGEGYNPSAGMYQPVRAPNEMEALSRSNIPSPRNGQVTMPKRGPLDLVTWLRTQGGLRPQGGELDHYGITNAPRNGMEFTSGEGRFGRLVDPERGMSFDDAAERAHEAGFFPDSFERPTVEEFLDSVAQTHSGNSRAFRPDDQPQIDDFYAAREQKAKVINSAQEGAPLVRDTSQPMTAADFDNYSAPMPSRFPNMEPDPVGAPSMVYDMQTLDYTKRGMDEVLEKYRNPLTQRLDLTGGGRVQNNVKNEFLSEVDRLNPAYREARRVYQGPMESIDALHRGQDFYNPNINANQVAASVGEQTPEHLGQMQLGYRDALMERANKTAFSSNPWNATLGNPASETKLSAMYPGSPGPATMFAQRDLENQMARTATRVIGGSQTAGRQVADQSFLPGAAASGAIDVATAATGGIPVASVGRMLASSKIGDALRLGLGKKAEAKAAQLGPMLLNQSPDANLALVRELLGKSQAYQGFVNATTPRRAGGIFGAALTGNAASGYVR